MRPRMELIASISLSPGIVSRAAKSAAEALVYTRSPAPRPDSALETIEGLENIARRWRRRTGRAIAPWSRRFSPTAPLWPRMMRRWALSWKANGRGAAWRYFNVKQFLVDRSWYMRWLTARPNMKPVYFVHDLIPIEAPEFFRAREAMLHSRRMSKIRRYGAGAVVGSQAVARRLRASAEETPPIPMLFLQRLTTSSRNYKARFDADQN